LYFVGTANDRVYQYSCSDAWNVSNCSWDGSDTNLSITNQDTTPRGLDFKPDGTKLYFVGSTGDRVYQYSCSDAWNVSNCSWDGSDTNLSITNQDGIPQGLAFKPDGTKLYVIGDAGNSVYQYSLYNDSNTIHNFSSLNFSADGNYNWTIQSYDGNNYSYIETGFFTIDTTAPTITFSCSSSSVFAGETITCTCTATDALVGVQETTFTSSPSTSSTGDFTTSCTSKDNLNNSATSNLGYTVIAPIYGGGGSSTPSSGEPTLTKTTTIVNVNSGTPTTITSFESTGVREIRIIMNQPTQNIKIQVLKYDTKPANVTKNATGKNYRYLAINTENLNENLTSATVKFEVEKSFVSNNNLQKEDVAVFKFNETQNEWKELETVFDFENGNYYVYRVELNSFSYFSIGEKTRVPIIPDSEIVIPEEPIKEKLGLILWWLVFGILLVGIILVGLLIVKNVKGRENGAGFRLGNF
jgi:PGF-pre-PGF domain-containing protein